MDAEKFWGRVEKTDSCWFWQGARAAHGYGAVRAGGRQTGAHRHAFALTTGKPIPAGLCVLHRCDNPPCVNPAHLFLGTHADNSDDMRKKGRADFTASMKERDVFGASVTAARANLKHSQTDAADYCGCSLRTWQRIEQGEGDTRKRMRFMIEAYLRHANGEK